MNPIDPTGDHQAAGAVDPVDPVDEIGVIDVVEPIAVVLPCGSTRDQEHEAWRALAELDAFWALYDEG